MSNKIFVGGLPKSAGGSDLNTQLFSYFSNFGTVAQAEVKCDHHGLNRGFGFVEFANPAGAEKALEHYEQHKIWGKWVEVKRYSQEMGRASANVHALARMAASGTMRPDMVTSIFSGQGQGGCSGVVPQTDAHSLHTMQLLESLSGSAGVGVDATVLSFLLSAIAQVSATTGASDVNMSQLLTTLGIIAAPPTCNADAEALQATQAAQAQMLAALAVAATDNAGCTGEAVNFNSVYANNFNARISSQEAGSPDCVTGNMIPRQCPGGEIADPGSIISQDLKGANSSAYFNVVRPRQLQDMPLQNAGLAISDAVCDSSAINHGSGHDVGVTNDAGLRGERKVFVGGLPQTVDTQKLYSYFSQFGPILSAEVAMDKVTGNSKGYGFIQFQTIDAITKVLAHYNDHTFDGKWVEVRQFGDKAPDRKGGKGPGDCAVMTAAALAALGCGIPGGLSSGKEKTIFIGGLPRSVGDQRLKTHFEQFGNVLRADVKIDKETGQSRGFGFVEFQNDADVDSVLQKREASRIDGKWIDVKRFGDKGVGRAGKGFSPMSGTLPSAACNGGNNVPLIAQLQHLAEHPGNAQSAGLLMALLQRQPNLDLAGRVLPCDHSGLNAQLTQFASMDSQSLMALMNIVNGHGLSDSNIAWGNNSARNASGVLPVAGGFSPDRATPGMRWTPY